MTENEITQQIKTFLQAQSDIFDDEVAKKLRSGVSSKKVGELIYVYAPVVGRGVIDGFKLKHDKGFISIFELWKKEGRNFVKIQYTYKYITSEYVYNCSNNGETGGNTRLDYSFHFDMDLRHPAASKIDGNELVLHDAHHLQIIHPHPRFPSKDFSVPEFLLVVKKACFSKERPLSPREEPFFLIK